MKLKYTFEIMELDDTTVAVPVGNNSDEFRGVVKLNETAAKIFQLLKDNITESEIITIIKGQFGESDPNIELYVHEYLEQLEREELLA